MPRIPSQLSGCHVLACPRKQGHTTANTTHNDKRKIPTYLLAYLLTLIIKELKISVEQGRWKQH